MMSRKEERVMKRRDLEELFGSLCERAVEVPGDDFDQPPVREAVEAVRRCENERSTHQTAAADVLRAVRNRHLPGVLLHIHTRH